MKTATLGLGLGLLSVLVSACGGGGGAAPGTGTAASVQSSGMSQSFAGQNKCNPKNAERPFIIEWDATDMSSFESKAANDVIFVKYEGCDLKVLDACADDSVKGAFGSYKAVDWTSGSLESLEINNSGELYAKLPLGAATLGGRVEGGEKFRMEYFVSGTRTATRPSIFRGDLKKVPQCKGATHFVYAYNLGAFALGAQSNLKGTVGGSAFGFGAGGSRSSSSKADKQGGVLGSCRAESAKDVQTCTVPIRLTLRELTDGESADTKDSQAPETPEAANLAGRLKASNDRERKAGDHGDSARTKMASRDGKGCLAELDAHDKLDPRPAGLSTNVASYYSMLRSQCLMLSGSCPAGKELMRKAMEKTSAANFGPEQIDRGVDAQAGMYCQGNLGGRDAITRATQNLTQGAYMSKKEASFCQENIKTLRTMIPTTPPKDEDDSNIINAPDALRNSGTACLVKAGDCAAAWALYQDLNQHPEIYKFAKPERQELIKKGANMPVTTLRLSFDAMNSKCKGQ